MSLSSPPPPTPGRGGGSVPPPSPAGWLPASRRGGLWGGAKASTEPALLDCRTRAFLPRPGGFSEHDGGGGGGGTGRPRRRLLLLSELLLTAGQAVPRPALLAGEGRGETPPTPAAAHRRSRSCACCNPRDLLVRGWGCCGGGSCRYPAAGGARGRACPG